MLVEVRVTVRILTVVVGHQPHRPLPEAPSGYRFGMKIILLRKEISAEAGHEFAALGVTRGRRVTR